MRRLIKRNGERDIKPVTPTYVPWSAVLPDWSLSRRTMVALTFGGAALLILLNNLTVLGAHLSPLAGYTPQLMTRGQDSSEYSLWIRAFERAWAIPDFNAPWRTTARQRMPLMWLAALASRDGRSVGQTYLLFQAITCLLAVWGLVRLLRTFTDSFRQALLAVMLAVCTLSWKTLLLIPVVIFDRTNWMWASGFWDFVGGDSSDGFFQGASGSFTVTLGTASTLISLWLLGSYLASRRRRALLVASLVIAASGLLHPFEFLAVGISGAILLRRAGDPALETFADLLILGLPSAAAAAFYAGQTLGSEWMTVAADVNRQLMLKFPASLFNLGWPPLAALLLIPFSWRAMSSPRDRLLKVYVITVFVGVHLPIVQPQHLIDGFYYAAAVLLARQLDQLPGATRLWADVPRWRLTALGLLLAYALAVRGFFAYETLTSGMTVTGPYITSALVSNDELGVIAWLRANAHPDDLVLAPGADASWITTVPIHSFGSHWQFSLTYRQQAALAKSFLTGRMSAAEADGFLRCYGFRYVVIPVSSPATRYLERATVRTRIGSLAIIEFAGRSMFPLPQLHKSAPGVYDFACPGEAGHLRATAGD